MSGLLNNRKSGCKKAEFCETVNHYFFFLNTPEENGDHYPQPSWDLIFFRYNNKKNANMIDWPFFFFSSFLKNL